MANGVWTEFTPKKRQRFLDLLRRQPNITRAARKVGISRQCAYQLRDVDPEFAEAWQEAIEEGLDELEGKAQERASKTSDLLMIFLLKAYRPQVFNRAPEPATDSKQTIEVIFRNEGETKRDTSIEVESSQVDERALLPALPAPASTDPVEK